MLERSIIMSVKLISSLVIKAYKVSDNRFIPNNQD
jgi:hypothetical protein